MGREYSSGIDGVKRMRWEFFAKGGPFSDVDATQWVRRDGELLGVVRRVGGSSKWEAWKGDEQRGVTVRGWYETRQQAAEALWNPAMERPQQGDSHERRLERAMRDALDALENQSPAHAERYLREGLK